MKKNNNTDKHSLKKHFFNNLFFPIAFVILIIIVSISIIFVLNENKNLNILLINETNLLANLTENSKLYDTISLNHVINSKSSIIFRDPIAKYEIFFTRQSPFPLEKFDLYMIEKKNGYFLYGKYKIFFAESYLSRVCVVIVPRMLFHITTIKTIIIGLFIYFFITFMLYLIIIKIEKKISFDITKQYIFMKYILEGKYKESDNYSTISEIDNIRYGLNNLIKILKERREFYNYLILFQKKLLDLIPVGILIFNENGYFEDANNFGYAQIEREIKKNTINIDDSAQIINEKFTIDSIVTNESLNLLNDNNTLELKIKPEITFAKKVFGRIISNKKVILLVPLNINIDEDNDQNISILRQTLSLFISDFAHELRSPLNSILGFSQIIKDGVEGDNIVEIINDNKIINESGQIMMAFIDDIIFLSRLGLKSYSSYNVSFNLSILFTLINHYFKGIFKNKDTTINIEENIEKKEINADFQTIRRIVFLSFFYLRSLFPLPNIINVNLVQRNGTKYRFEISYFFPQENYQKQKVSDIVIDLCNDIAKETSLDFQNIEEDKNNRKILIEFNYKI